MKKQIINVLLAVTLMLNVSVVSAQNPKVFFEVATYSGERFPDAKIVKADETKHFITVITHLPDLTKYDLVVATISFKGINKTVAFYQQTGKEMWADTKNSSKTPGMKYIQFVITNAEIESQGGYFTIDGYPFEGLDVPYLFSKEENDNLDSYTMEISLDGRMITGYEDKWENNTHKRIPVYGNFINIAESASITILTSSAIQSVRAKKQAEDRNSFLDAINAGNKKVDDLRK